MAIESLQTQLERVQAAIAAVELGNQSYTVEGRSFTKADLPVLYARERQLKAEIGAEENGTRAYVGGAGWPTT